MEHVVTNHKEGTDDKIAKPPRSLGKTDGSFGEERARFAAFTEEYSKNLSSLSASKQGWAL
jgi:hypothetical protein